MQFGPLNISLNFSKRASKGASKSLKDPALGEWFGGLETSSGARVTPETALQVSAVFACVRIISEGVAGLPLKLYRRLPDGGREVAREHPLYKVLHDEPNEEMTAFELREALQGGLCLRGNSYAFIDWSRGGRVKQLIPLHPDRVQVERLSDGTLIYRFTPDSGEIQVYSTDEILHLRAFGDGIMGKNPIQLHRESIGLAMSAEEYGGRLFSNGTHIGKVLKHPESLGPEAQERLKKQFESMHGGIANAHRPIVLEEGMSLEKIGMSSQDAQFLETRKFQVNDIARIFRVPPHKIGELERATFSNVDAQAIEFVTDTLTPWLVRWEQRLSKSLLSPRERETYYFKHSVDGLLRGDPLTRARANHIKRQNGVLNADEWRAEDEKNPLPEEKGQEYWRPANMEELNNDAMNGNQVVSKAT